MAEKHHKKPQPDWSKAIFWFVLISLVCATFFTAIRIFQISSGAIADPPHQQLKSDHTLMLIQCILGIIVIFLPSMLVRKLNFNIPKAAVIAYFIFIYCAIFLGEIRSFYYRFEFWDDLLHLFSGGMLAILGFIIVDALNTQKKIQVALSPLFVALFAFCFALTIGVLWEIWEFAFDSILGLNMQKFALETGELLVGREALSDTMHDLTIDAVAAFGVAAICYCILKTNGSKSIGSNIS